MSLTHSERDRAAALLVDVHDRVLVDSGVPIHGPAGRRHLNTLRALREGPGRPVTARDALRTMSLIASLLIRHDQGFWSSALAPAGHPGARLDGIVAALEAETAMTVERLHTLATEINQRLAAGPDRSVGQQAS